MTSTGNAQPESPVLVLFRKDLRVADNRALAAAADTGLPVIPVFIFDQSRGVRAQGAASLWWLHNSLEALGGRLKALGAPLLLRRGPMREVVEQLVDDSGATHIFWNRRYDPAEAKVDAEMKAALRERGLVAESFDGALLHEPSKLKTGGGGPYKVYSPFWRALVASGEPRGPVDAPTSLKPFQGKLRSDRLADWKLLPKHPDWAGGMPQFWEPGEAGAQKRLKAFLGGALDGYGEGRDLPGIDGTSRLSPHLAHGEITPFQIFAALGRKGIDAPARDIEKFRMELGWREFCYHLLFHNPDLASSNFNRDFDALHWRTDAKALHAWQRGRTGYPIVDAGMRQLWATGWMHNRVRMIVASFLIKHLMIDWRHGETWFWDTLVDADAANNPASWQWVAGSGADAAPYFRIFNPILQGEKFDPDGDYVRRWIPELDRMPKRFVHRPWEAPVAQLREAGVKLGESYPVPLVDHDRARGRALQAYQSMRGT